MVYLDLLAPGWELKEIRREENLLLTEPGRKDQ